MSHELRTPLNHIIGFTDLLLAKDFGEINETQEEYLQDIIQSGSHLLLLINEVLDRAKTVANMLELNQMEIPVQSFISGCLGFFPQNTQNNGIRFIWA